MGNRYVVTPDDGETVWLLRLGARGVLAGGETDGRFSLVEHPLPPRALGAPVHTHEHEDEYSFVLEGEVGVEIGGESFVAGAGALVRKPRGIPHAFWNAGDEPARILEIISPAGFERYFPEAAALFADGVIDPQRAARLWARYGLTMDISSLPRLIAAHNLVVEPAPLAH